MTVPARPRSRWLWLEYAFAIGVLALIAKAMASVLIDGYLPQPFFYETNDTFMDWFNTAYWARDPNVYDSWRTVYPPLSFVVLRLLGKDSCYGDAEVLTWRDCDWVGLGALFAIFVLNIVLVALTFRKIDARTAIPRAIALSAGLPMLYALDRGNILLLCFTAVLLAFGPLVKSARLRWLFAGIAVNLKIYLIGAIAVQLLRRRWLWCEGALIATLLVYLLSYGLQGGGTPFEIMRNISEFSSMASAAQVLDVWYTLTYQPLILLLQGETFPVSAVIGSQLSDVGLIVLPLFVRIGQASILAAAVATWLRPEVVPPYRVAFLGIALAAISSEAGGYTQIMVLLFVFMEPWRGRARPIALIACYILCLPGEIILGSVVPLIRDSYLGGRKVEIEFGIGLGMFLRPGLVILVAVSLSMATIRDVWADIRQQGWKGRWRYRRDWPMLPWIARPHRHPPSEGAAA